MAKDGSAATTTAVQVGKYLSICLCFEEATGSNKKYKQIKM